MSRVDAALVTGWTRYGYLMCPHTAVGYAATQHTEEWAYDPASHGPQVTETRFSLFRDFVGASSLFVCFSISMFFNVLLLIPRVNG